MTDNDASTPGTPGDPEPRAQITSAEQDKRVAARRRFLRAGAAGSTTLVVTVLHQRAFAGTGAKKATIGSAALCGSLKGTPDLTKAKGQKLQVSALGTPKNFICRPKPPVVDPNPVGSCIPADGNGSWGPRKLSAFANASGTHYQIVNGTQLNEGCGDLNTTISSAYNYRLYEEGYCPLTYNSITGVIGYDPTMVYYKTDASGKVKSGPIACQ